VSRLSRFPTLGLLILTGCGVEAETKSGEAAGAVQEVPSLVEAAHVIQLGGGRDQEHVLPPNLEISVGEWVEFVTLDRRVHTLSFVADSLSTEALEYLRGAGQLHSPPLLERGTRFFVDFREAPEGRYVFSSRSHGEPVYGSVTVR
jgi:plastocyanin